MYHLYVSLQISALWSVHIIVRLLKESNLQEKKWLNLPSAWTSSERVYQCPSHSAQIMHAAHTKNDIVELAELSWRLDCATIAMIDCRSGRGCEKIIENPQNLIAMKLSKALERLLKEADNRRYRTKRRPTALPLYLTHISRPVFGLSPDTPQSRWFVDQVSDMSNPTVTVENQSTAKVWRPGLVKLHGLSWFRSFRPLICRLAWEPLRALHRTIKLSLRGMLARRYLLPYSHQSGAVRLAQSWR